MTTQPSTDVREAVKDVNDAYNEMLDVRAKSRDGSRKVRAAEAAWAGALVRRTEAVRTYYQDQDSPLGVLLRRWYAESRAPARKRKRPSSA